MKPYSLIVYFIRIDVSFLTYIFYITFRMKIIKKCPGILNIRLEATQKYEVDQIIPFSTLSFFYTTQLFSRIGEKKVNVAEIFPR